VAALLLDENIPRSAGRSSTEAGHDVVHIADTAPTAGDRSVLARARESGRSLVTLDADFGDLVYQHGEPPPPAILYLRVHPIDGAIAATMVLQALAGPVAGYFVVCTPDGLRRRPLPFVSDEQSG
jgi:predicted nuclease of predicted toxin-antitoxin system